MKYEITKKYIAAERSEHQHTQKELFEYLKDGVLLSPPVLSQGHQE